MSTILYKASELRKPLKMMLPTSESKNSNSAKRVYVGLTSDKKCYGMVLRTEQVGFLCQMFYPIVEIGTQDEMKVFDISPDDTLCLVDTKALDRALATFGTQDVRITITESQVTVENSEQSCVLVRSADTRQLTLPLDGTQTIRRASTMACSIDSDNISKMAVKVPLVDLCNALLPAAKITTMAGNTGDKRGIHLHIEGAMSSEQSATAEMRLREKSGLNLRVVGAHTDAVFVYEGMKVEMNDNAADGFVTLRDGAIISPDAAKRLRELLISELNGGADEKSGSAVKEVWMWLAGDMYLCVCCGDWLMMIEPLDICETDCQAYLDMPGKNVFEAERVRLMQALNGLRLMGETEVLVTLQDDCIRLEGESQAHRGERVLVVSCKRYGEHEQIPVRKYAIVPMITMLSAASACENNKIVKLMTDLDDNVMCLQCEEYNVFVK